MAQESHNGTEVPDAPPNWHYGIGNGGPSHYTTWLYTDEKWPDPDGEYAEYGLEVEMYWDEGHGRPDRRAHVAILYEMWYNEEGDIAYDRQLQTRYAPTEAENLQHGVEMAANAEVGGDE